MHYTPEAVYLRNLRGCTTGWLGDQAGPKLTFSNSLFSLRIAHQIETGERGISEESGGHPTEQACNEKRILLTHFVVTSGESSGQKSHAEGRAPGNAISLTHLACLHHDRWLLEPQ